MANSGKTVIVAALDGTFQRKVSHSNLSLHVIMVGPPVVAAAIRVSNESRSTGRERHQAQSCLSYLLP